MNCIRWVRTMDLSRCVNEGSILCAEMDCSHSELVRSCIILSSAYVPSYVPRKCPSILALFGTIWGVSRKLATSVNQGHNFDHDGCDQMYVNDIVKVLLNL